MSAEQMVPSAHEIQWPDFDKLRKSQEDNSSEPKNGLLSDDEDKLWKRNGIIWIPDLDEKLRLNLLLVSHCCSMGHCDGDVTKNVLMEMLFCNNMDRDADRFVSQCYHCILMRSGARIPKPLGTALHGTKPNEVRQTDFLYMGPRLNGKNYMLILRDGLSSYARLWATEAADSDESASGE